MAEYIEKQKAIKLLDMCMAAAEKRWKEAANPLAKIEFKADKDTIEAMIEVVVSVESADVQPVRYGRWITKAEDYYKAWQDSGRSWDDMPYFVTGLKFACSNCFEQFDVNAEGVEKWNGCPLCLARMDGEQDD